MENRTLVLQILLFLLMCSLCHNSIAQKVKPNDSLVYHYYNNYQYSKLIQLLKDKELNDNLKVVMGKSEYALGQYKNAIKNFGAVIKNDSSKLSTYLNLAKAYSKIEQKDKAIEVLEKLCKKDSGNPYFLKQLAKKYESNRQYMAATATYTKTLDINPDDIDATVSLIDLYNKLGFSDKAFQMAEKAKKKFPNNKIILLTHLKSAYKSKSYAKAFATANQLLTKGDSSLIVQKIGGIAAFQIKDYATSIVLLHNLIRVEKKNDILFYYLGVAYREVDSLKLSQQFLEKSIELAVSDNLETYYSQLANSYEKDGNYAKSIYYYKMAYKISSKQLLLYQLARNYDLYYQDKSVAFKYYKQYLATDDTANRLLLNYSKRRIKEIKSNQHFKVDSMN